MARVQLKRAGVQDPNSSELNFEKTFSDIAYARLRDKAPSMLDYLVGFQLIDKNEEETHAVGVFGFKVGKEWVYAPVFFINGELKGYELMYIKSQDAFVPLTEEWVNYVLNRRPSLLGEKEDTPRNELAIRQPDFDVFARSPYIGSKMAAFEVAPEFKSFLSVFNSENWPNAEKYASLQERFTIPGFIRKFGKEAMVNLVASMRKDEKFANSILSFYTFQDITKAAEEAKTIAEGTNYDSAVPDEKNKVKNKKYMSQEEKDDANRNKQKINSLLPGSPAPGSTPVVLTESDCEKCAHTLTAEEKSLLLRQRYLVKDAREEDAKSKVYSTQTSQSMQSPSESAVYDVMDVNGKPRKMLVVVKPVVLGYRSRGEEGMSFVLDLENKAAANTVISELLSAKQYPTSEWDKQVSSGVDPSSVSVGDNAIVIGPRGSCTTPFEVTNKISGGGNVELKIWGRSVPTIASTDASLRSNRTDPGADAKETIDSLVFTGKDAGALKQIGRSLYVPSSYKVVVLEKVKPAKSGKGYAIACREEGPSVQLGNINTFWQKLYKEARAGGMLRELRILTDGICFRSELNGKQSAPLSKVAAIKHLIQDLGLGAADAEFLLKEAAPRKAKKYLLKLSYASSYQGSGDAPRPGFFPDPILGSEKGLMVPSQYPQTELQNIGNIDPSNRQAYHDYRYVDDDAKREATGAAERGQREVLDTSVITGLIKTIDSDETVNSYIGDLLLGLDRIGRVLLMFYWHNDKFKDRYGQQDLPELEDNLKNVFKNLGELTLFLKQKMVEPEEANSAEAELTDVMG